MPTPNPALPEKDASADLAGGFLVGGGRFSLLRELARGGMGVVWLAHDERLMASVALKFLPAAVRSNPAALNDLRQETQRSRLLSHPNIIRIYDLYEAPDEPAFISMEYVDGPTLGILRLRQARNFFSWDFLKPIVRQLCDALDYAHGEKVIHRDLKPANMLLDERQRLRLADFGIAAMDIEFSTSGTSPRRSKGTPAYMSPQQIEGKTARVSDDIYALGATLYELLSGLPPFYENDIAYQVCNVLATPLSERLADLEVDNEVPPAVAALIMACLSKDPEKRPQSARAVAEWIGRSDEAVSPVPGFVPRVVTAPEASEPAKEMKKAIVALAMIEETHAPPSGMENAARRLTAMLAASAALGLLAWLAWGQFGPKMPDLPASLSAPTTNAVDAAGTNASNAAPAPDPTGAAAPALSGITVGIELGAVNGESGLRQAGGPELGPTTPANIGGKECRLMESRRNARCYFRILPAFKRPGAMNARIQVEYYAAVPGALQVKFDGPSKQTPHYSNGGKINFDGKEGWRITNYQINDAVFRGGEMGGADFCLVATCEALYIHSVTVFFDQ